MDPDDPLAPLRDHAQQAIAHNTLALSQPPAAPATSSLPGDDCEFVFVGGAGTGGPYLESLRQSLERAGIQHVSVPNQGDGHGDPRHDAPNSRIAADVAAIPDINDLGFAKSLISSPEIKAAARHSHSLGDEQFNLGGYSYGAAAQAANAYAIAENGGRVDNLVLLGAPINRDLYDAVKNHPNIKNVITLDLGAYGDPVHAGLSDLDLLNALPTLRRQQKAQTGHFFYSKDGPEGDARRDALAQSLVHRGVR